MSRGENPGETWSSAVGKESGKGGELGESQVAKYVLPRGGTVRGWSLRGAIHSR